MNYDQTQFHATFFILRNFSSLFSVNVVDSLFFVVVRLTFFTPARLKKIHLLPGNQFCLIYKKSEPRLTRLKL